MFLKSLKYAFYIYISSKYEKKILNHTRIYGCKNMKCATPQLYPVEYALTYNTFFIFD